MVLSSPPLSMDMGLSSTTQRRSFPSCASLPSHYQRRDVSSSDTATIPSGSSSYVEVPLRATPSPASRHPLLRRPSTRIPLHSRALSDTEERGAEVFIYGESRCHSDDEQSCNGEDAPYDRWAPSSLPAHTRSAQQSAGAFTYARPRLHTIAAVMDTGADAEGKARTARPSSSSSSSVFRHCNSTGERGGGGGSTVSSSTSSALHPPYTTVNSLQGELHSHVSASLPNTYMGGFKDVCYGGESTGLCVLSSCSLIHISC